MKFIVLEIALAEALDGSFDPKALGLISQGSCAAGSLYLSPDGSVPENFREATSEEVGESFMYKARAATLNKQRDGVIMSGVDVDGIGRFDTDLVAQLRQSAGLQLSSLPIIRALYSAVYDMAVASGDTETTAALDAARTEFKTDWVLQDNTTVELGFDEFKVIGPTVAAAVAEQVLTARTQKDEQLAKLAAGDIAA